MEIFKLFGSILVDNEKANESISKTEGKAEGLGGKFTSMIGTVGKWGIAIGAAAAAVAISVGTVALKAAVDFEKQMANVATLLDGDVKTKIGNLGETVKKLSADTGTSTELLTDGLYQVISAFGETEDSMKILETAAKGASAGNATVTDSVNLLSAVTKGYGDTSAEAAQKASDLAFLTVKLGQTSFPELASSMGKVIPLASTMKVSQEELFGAMATLTGVTGGTAEVTTQLRATIQGFLQPSKNMQAQLEKLGYANGQAAIESEGLGGILNKLKDSVDGNEIAFSGLFSSVEAKNAVLALTGAQADNFTEKTLAMMNAVGATEDAFEKQQATVSAMWDRIKASTNVVLISLGEQLLPVLQLFLSWVMDRLPQIQKIFEVVFDVLGKVMGEVVGVIEQHLIPMLEFLWAWVEQYLPEIQVFFQEVFEVIKEVIVTFVALTQKVWEKYGEDIKNITTVTFNNIKTVIETILNIIRGIITTVTGIMSGDWSKAWEGIGQIFKAVWEGMKNLLPSLLEGLYFVMRGSFGVFKNIGRGMFDMVWEGMKGIWGGISSWVGDKVNWLTDKLTFWKKSESDMSKSMTKLSKVAGNAKSHFTGLDYVPYHNYPALLHKGERVLTAEENKAMSNGVNSGQKIENIFNISSLVVREEADIDKIAQKLYEKINRGRRIAGVTV